MSYLKKIIGDKCYLSPIDSKDAARVVEWSNDLEISLNTGDISDLITLEKQKKYLENMNHHGYGFMIIESSTSTPIGIVRLMNIDYINRTSTFGIFIAKNYWQKGYGLEATKLILDFAFNIINLNNVMLEVFSFNSRGIRSYEKVGFKEIGRRRQAVLYGKKQYDLVYMDILSDEFQFSEMTKSIQ